MMVRSLGLTSVTFEVVLVYTHCTHCFLSTQHHLPTQHHVSRTGTYHRRRRARCYKWVQICGYLCLFELTFCVTGTAGYKVGEKKSVNEYASLDAEDESLARWKASLGIGASTSSAVDPNAPRVSG